MPIPGIEPRPPALGGLHWFGIVQAILADRTADWLDFYQTLFGFAPLPRGQHFGVLPGGTLLESPCQKFYLQLIEPPSRSDDTPAEEGLVRTGMGAPDVPLVTRTLRVPNAPYRRSKRTSSRSFTTKEAPQSAPTARR